MTVSHLSFRKVQRGSNFNSTRTTEVAIEVEPTTEINQCEQELVLADMRLGSFGHHLLFLQFQELRICVGSSQPSREPIVYGIHKKQQERCQVLL